MVAEEMPFGEQQDIAIAFNDSNEVALKALGTTLGIDAFYLGLPESVYPNPAGSMRDITPSLLKAATTIGIQLTTGACLERENYSRRGTKRTGRSNLA